MGGAPRRHPVRAWVDLASPGHPFFFRSLLAGLDGVTARTTAREKTETVPLARELGIEHTVVGRDYDRPLARKFGIPYRTLQLVRRMPPCDVSLSLRNAMCVLASRVRGVPSVHFTDNDIMRHDEGVTGESVYARLEAAATHNVVPAAFDTTVLTDRGADPERVHRFDGTKEDLYVADFDPDPAFGDRVPFDPGSYVVVRPEALDATYVHAERSLVPALLDRFVERGVGVVYLPRGRGDRGHAAPYDPTDVYVPSEPLDGLQLAWHARCVLTGSGTMAREAAAMETPAVSFFPGPLLSVDRDLTERGRLFHSRDPAAVVEHVGSTEPTPGGDTERARRVRREAVDLTADLIDRCVDHSPTPPRD
ncbi:DUF354 domain-containing protein [Candidatus Halobonum tyrrellensis]|uniref:DUF354 domain-containing protein n=1 Tax=Candidatus Halobonum tyrrellensis G22 TaxID=1324957 RepID=V4IUN1_9EURY|nr:DUF354 domain-containing protein [Candidatus Halobonum tyrrellensis]ESP86897.1 hypothetical protein K933_16587 [Candidatus Halobonum tyrrellensis G22]